MFTGIVQNLGTLKAKKPVKAGLALEIHSTLSAKDLQKGTSIAVNGACLTVEKYDPKTKIFQVTCVPETLAKTTFQESEIEAQFNLEPSLRMGDSLAGHFVLGHVDFMASVLHAAPELKIKIPPKFTRYFPKKGSITVHGVSLTIAEKGSDSIGLALIPETLKQTNLGDLKEGDLVHIEIDVLARYLESLNPSV